MAAKKRKSFISQFATLDDDDNDKKKDFNNKVKKWAKDNLRAGQCYRLYLMNGDTNKNTQSYVEVKVKVLHNYFTSTICTILRKFPKDSTSISQELEIGNEIEVYYSTLFKGYRLEEEIDKNYVSTHNEPIEDEYVSHDYTKPKELTLFNLLDKWMKDLLSYIDPW